MVVELIVCCLYLSASLLFEENKIIKQLTDKSVYHCCVLHSQLVLHTYSTDILFCIEVSIDLITNHN